MARPQSQNRIGRYVRYPLGHHDQTELKAPNFNKGIKPFTSRLLTYAPAALSCFKHSRCPLAVAVISEVILFADTREYSPLNKASDCDGFAL